MTSTIGSRFIAMGWAAGALLLWAALAQAAGPEERTELVRSPCGITYVVNSAPAHVTLEVSGNRFVQEPSGRIIVDDVTVTVAIVRAAKLGERARGKTGVPLLREHEKWEAEYQAQALKSAVQPRETGLVVRQKDRVENGLLWWFPSPVGPIADATLEVGGQIVSITAQGMRGMPPTELMQRVGGWMKTITISPSPIPAALVWAPLKGDASPGCASGFTPVLEGQWAALERGPRGYESKTCAFKVEYPGSGWEALETSTADAEPCMANLATPLVHDPDDNQDITNAVLIVATRTAEGQTVEQQHAKLLAPLLKVGAQVEKAPASLSVVQGALHSRYRVTNGGDQFVGELITWKRGAHLYTVHFNSTPGTVEAGRKHFLALMARATWNAPTVR